MIPMPTILESVAQTLACATDAQGRKLESSASRVPASIANAMGEPSPASHMNFVIANGVVVVPVYGTPSAHARARGTCKAYSPPERS